MRCLALAAASLGLVVLGAQSLPVMAQTDMAQTDAAQADTTGTLPVAAKPADFASKEEEAGIEQSFAMLRDELAENEVAQPAQAIAQYEAFFNEKGKRSIRVGIAISSLIAKLYWLGLHQPQKAQATYDWAIATYRNQPGFERLYLEEQLLQNPKTLDVPQVKVAPNLKAPLVPDAVRVASQVQAKAPLAVATVHVGQAPTQGGKVEVARVAALPEANRTKSVDVKGAVVGGAPVAFGVPLVGTVTMPKARGTQANGAAQVAKVDGKAVPQVKASGATSMARVVEAPRSSGVKSVDVKGVAVSGAPSTSTILTVEAVTIPKPAARTPIRVPEVQIGGTQTATTARTNVAGVKVLANGTARGMAPDASSVGGRPLLLASIDEQMRAGVLTPEEAWKNGSLTINDVMQILNTSGDWIVGEVQHDNGMHRGLAKLLIEHGGEKLKDMGKVPPKVRVWLADYFQVNRDARAVEWSESILSEVKTPVKGENVLVIQAVERLARYYAGIGELRKSADTWLRAKDTLYADEPGWWVQDTFLEAARRYMSLGDQKKARELYARVAQYGDDWITGLALYDQARALIAQNEYKEARRLLHLQLKGDRADEMRVRSLSLLGISYYLTGSFEEAGKFSKESVAQYERLKSPANSIVRVHADAAKETLRLIRQWAETPIICNPTQIYIIATSNKKTISRKLTVRSFRSVPLSVTSDDVRVRARLIDNERPKNEKTPFEREVIVNIDPQATNGRFESTLVISSPNFADYKLLVDVEVDVQDSDKTSVRKMQ